jgi:dihydroflavonol-4-reductase
LAAALLGRGVEVVGVCQPGAPTLAIEGLAVRRITGDILDGTAMRRAMQGVQWVFHTAAIADDWRFPAGQIYETNVVGTQTVLAAALSAGVERLVLTSSAAALGMPRPGGGLLNEDSAFNLAPEAWVYAHSKVLAEQAMQAAVRQGLEAMAVLPTAILGPADSKQITGQLIIRASRGELLPFPPGGVNYIDVRDVAEAHIAAAQRGRPGERYLLGGHNLSHLHCLGTIADALGAPVHYLQLPKAALPAMAAAIGALRRMGLPTPIDPQRVRISGEYLYYDNRKAVQALGLRPRPFDETVAAAVRWYAEHGLLPQRRQPAGRGALKAVAELSCQLQEA